MKKNYKNGRINYKPRENGGYLQLASSLLNDNKISSDAFRLFCFISNLPPDFEIVLKSIRKKLDWTDYRMTAASNSLKENGYLKQTKKNNKDNYEYTYTLSEFGDLINKEETLVLEENKAITKVVKQQVEPEPIQEEEVPSFDNIIIGKPKIEDEYELPSEEEYNATKKNKMGDISFSQFHELTKNKFSKSHPFFVPDGRNYKDFINICKELNNEIKQTQLQ